MRSGARMRLTQTDSRLILRAPAKLNLFLEVLGRRPDGFHELETLMVAIDIHDTLILADEPQGRVRVFPVTCSRPAADTLVPWDEDNLVFRAARLLRERTGVAAGVAIGLSKQIPVAAGLAGGSSDAAAALVGLNRFWALGLSRRELQALAAELGSDISFFVCSGVAAVCRGRGEIVEPVRPSTPLHFVVVRPPCGLSTAQVYGHLQPAGEVRSVEEMSRALMAGDIGRAGRCVHNRLQPAAEALSEQVAGLRHRFARIQSHGHLMSGSGTSYFAICRGRRHAHQLAARLRAENMGSVFAASSCI